MLIRVFCVVQGCVGGGATGLLNKGGREQQASWFSKQQAVEFPHVGTDYNNNIVLAHSTVFQSLSTQLTPIGACTRMFPP